MKTVIKCLLITLGMLSAFSIHAWLPLPMLLGLLGVPLFLFNGIKKNYKIILLNEDLFLIFCLIIISISLMLNDISQTNINHAMAFFAVIFIYYFTIRNIIFNSQLSLKSLNKAIFIGVLLSSLYAIFEFFTKNYVTSLAFINDLIYRPAVQEYTPIYNETLIRARSFTEESGVFALYLNVFAPLSVYYINENFRAIKKYLYIITIIFSYLLSFSAGGIGFFVCSLLLTVIFLLIEKRSETKLKVKKIFSFVTVISLSAILAIVYKKEVSNFLNPLWDKITLENDSGRFNRWDKALSLFEDANFLQYFIGVGPGQVSEVFNTGTTSFYIDRLIENGVLGILFFLLFLLFVYKRLFKLKSKMKYVYFVSLTSVLFHYLIISNFWFPFLWVIIILIQYETVCEKVNTINTKNIQ